MTIKIDTGTEGLFLNKTGTPVFDTGTLTIVSQWSKKSETFNITKTFENDRYLVYSVDFGADFKDTHKNGIYWAKVGVVNVIEGSWFLLKIITEPGGQDGFTRYDSDPATEERQADVYYRPNY
jgi:hypothetical protein